jgi:plastocyanin
MKRLPFLGAVLLIATLTPPTLAAATVGGKVSFVTKRGQNPVAAETLVWLEPAGRASARKAGSFRMVTRGKTLVPHVLAIPAGSTVEFPNDDPISHNLFSLSSGNAFDLGLYRRGAGKTYKFDKPGLVNVYCNVHPSMSAVIHVLTTPWFAFADANGVYAIPDVPLGKYKLVAWNEQGGQSESPVEVTASGQVTGSVAVTLDSRNFRQASHTNKEGKPYSPASAREY